MKNFILILPDGALHGAFLFFHFAFYFILPPDVPGPPVQRQQEVQQKRSDSGQNKHIQPYRYPYCGGASDRSSGG